MKTIEITPEWVLNELPHMHVADGNGNMSFYTDSVTDVRWITLALNTLGISFQTFDERSYKITFFWFEFKIEDLKEDCPVLYTKWKQEDDTLRKAKEQLNEAYERFSAEHRVGIAPSILMDYLNLHRHLIGFILIDPSYLCWTLLSKKWEPKWNQYLIDSNLNNRAISRENKIKKLFLNWCADNHYLDDYKELVF